MAAPARRTAIRTVAAGAVRGSSPAPCCGRRCWCCCWPCRPDRNDAPLPLPNLLAYCRCLGSCRLRLAAAAAAGADTRRRATTRWRRTRPTTTPTRWSCCWSCGYRYPRTGCRSQYVTATTDRTAAGQNQKIQILAADRRSGGRDREVRLRLRLQRRPLCRPRVWSLSRGPRGGNRRLWPVNEPFPGPHRRRVVPTFRVIFSREAGRRAPVPTTSHSTRRNGSERYWWRWWGVEKGRERWMGLVSWWGM